MILDPSLKTLPNGAASKPSPTFHWLRVPMLLSFEKTKNVLFELENTWTATVPIFKKICEFTRRMFKYWKNKQILPGFQTGIAQVSSRKPCVITTRTPAVTMRTTSSNTNHLLVKMSEDLQGAGTVDSIVAKWVGTGPSMLNPFHLVEFFGGCETMGAFAVCVVDF